MPSVQELRHLYQLNANHLSREENLLLEAELFARLCEELKEVIKKENKDYFRLMKFTVEKENTMVDENFVRCLINDLLVSDEYSLAGIACYTNTPEEVVYEIAAGRNTSPSLFLARRIIELHRTVRPDIYKGVIQKIINENNVSA